MATRETTQGASLDRDTFNRICADVASECGIPVKQLMLHGNACALALYRVSGHFEGIAGGMWEITISSHPMLAWNRRFRPSLTPVEGEMLYALLRSGVLCAADLNYLSDAAMRARVSQFRCKLKGQYDASIDCRYGSKTYSMSVSDRKKIISDLGVGE